MKKNNFSLVTVNKLNLYYMNIPTNYRCLRHLFVVDMNESYYCFKSRYSYVFKNK